jgi:hypothetical protein
MLFQKLTEQKGVTIKKGQINNGLIRRAYILYDDDCEIETTVILFSIVKIFFVVATIIIILLVKLN